MLSLSDNSLYFESSLQYTLHKYFTFNKISLTCLYIHVHQWPFGGGDSHVHDLI